MYYITAWVLSNVITIQTLQWNYKISISYYHIMFQFYIFIYCKLCDLFYNHICDETPRSDLFLKSLIAHRRRARKFLSIIEFFKFASEAQDGEIHVKGRP